MVTDSQALGPPHLTEADARSAESHWAAYAAAHDLAASRGQTVGVEPRSGHMWFGDSILEVIRERDAAGVDLPLHFIRIGSEAYYRKGARR